MAGSFKRALNSLDNFGITLGSHGCILSQLNLGFALRF